MSCCAPSSRSACAFLGDLHGPLGASLLLRAGVRRALEDGAELPLDRTGHGLLAQRLKSLLEVRGSEPSERARRSEAECDVAFRRWAREHKSVCRELIDGARLTQATESFGGVAA